MTSAYTPVYSISLGSLQGACVDISCGGNTYKGASPCKYRLIDCVQYVRHDTLVIHEFDVLPEEPYSAASYIWRGKAFDPSFPEQRGFFSVLGAENGDPISMNVLYHICVASLQKKAKLLWLDRLCIIQQSRDDKAWQIQRMYGVYKACDPCVVLPGGLQRLVCLDEETEWIQRGWTLQEVMAPDDPLVLFRWRRGPGFFIGPTPFTGDLEEVVPGESALANIMDLLLPYLGGIMGGQTYFHLDEDREPQDKEEESGIEIKPVLFGHTASHALALLGALWPSVRDPDVVPHAVWRSALMRVSSRPVDMVLSIMGIFDVTLDPKAYPSHDRLGATIALAQEILRKGGSASWLIATMNLPPERRLSSFPVFPTTRVDGKAQVEVGGLMRDVEDVVGGDEFLERWSLKESPKGSMGDDGYLTIASQAIRVRRVDQRIDLQSHRVGQGCVCDTVRRAFFTALDGTAWQACEGESVQSPGPCPRTFVVYVGMALANPYSSQPTLQRYMQTYTLLAILVQEHAPGRYHRSSNLVLCHCFEKFIKIWHVRKFDIGPNMTLTQP
ncbi:hypothetical protein EDD18DRAFT_1135617 [Armillaria luteobubalina]|uniref:Heterokaryon incompatibility domain-containing protein n=1 Tax=Armillaria luteobubalina TaxID=153913 RepID=A0AA39QJC9_9AGAR|nr:hypothetical protein EDD18DRAFT_1135617 [Armillaria luteobubalina]